MSVALLPWPVKLFVLSTEHEMYNISFGIYSIKYSNRAGIETLYRVRYAEGIISYNYVSVECRVNIVLWVSVRCVVHWQDMQLGGRLEIDP